MDLCDKQGTRSAIVHAELLICTEYLYIRIESDHSLACTASVIFHSSLPLGATRANLMSNSDGISRLYSGSFPFKFKLQ